jgi:hypothetical protein
MRSFTNVYIYQYIYMAVSVRACVLILSICCIQFSILRTIYIYELYIYIYIHVDIPLLKPGKSHMTMNENSSDSTALYSTAVNWLTITLLWNATAAVAGCDSSSTNVSSSSE